MADIKVIGLDKLEKRLKKDASLSDVKKTVRKNGSELQRNMMKKADFHGHFEWEKGKGKVWKKPTGATKSRIHLEMQDGGFTASVGPETEYSPYLEFGTRFMEAQPFIKPALDEQKNKFLSDLKELLK